MGLTEVNNVQKEVTLDKFLGSHILPFRLWSIRMSGDGFQDNTGKRFGGVLWSQKALCGLALYRP